MQTIIRILTGFFLLIVFLGVIFTTFFFPSTQDIQEIDEILTPNERAFSGAFMHKTFSLNEEMFFASGSQDSFDLLDEENVKKIMLGKNSIVTSLRDIDHEYEILGDNFKITQSGPGEIFIDTMSEKNKVFIFALTTPVRLSLIGDDASESYSEIFLTPRMYIEFQPLRGKFLKDVDRIRIDTVFNLGYIAERIPGDIQDEIFQKYSQAYSSFFEKSYSYIQNKKVNAENVLQKFSDMSVIEIPGISMIHRYSNMFVNPEKKKVFYKNNILKGVIHIIQNKKEVDIVQIKQDIAKLKSLDEDSYNAVVTIFERSISRVLLSSSLDTLETKTRLYSLFQQSENNINISPYHLYSYSIFSSFDHGIDISNQMLRKNNDVFQEFLTSYEESIQAKEYYVYFLENMLGSELEKSGKKDFQKIVEIFTFLNDFAVSAYEKNIEGKISGMYIYNELLKKVESAMRQDMFIAERNSSNLLELQTNNTISIDTIQSMRDVVSEAIEFYTRNKASLDSSNIRDKNIAQSIQALSGLFEEYFLALENYEEYISRYDIVNQNAFQGIRQEGTHQYSREYIYTYLSQFIGLNLQNIGVNIGEKKYSMSNVGVSGKIFSFDIYPEDNHRMTNISIDGIDQSFEYKLDLRQEEWSENYSTAPVDEKSKYDFSRFFLLTFFESTQNQGNDIYVTADTSLNESKSEIVFKRDILLGRRGEFSDIADITNIEYKDIVLQKNQTNYDIFIGNANFTIQDTQEGVRQQEYSGEFKGNYTKKDKPEDGYFTSFSTNLYQGQSGQKKYLFGGNTINFFGKIPRKDFRDILQNFLLKEVEYSKSYEQIISLPQVSNISLQYSPGNKKMTYRFEKNQNNYTILQSEVGIEQILIGVQKQIPKPISPDEILNYIK